MQSANSGSDQTLLTPPSPGAALDAAREAVSSDDDSDNQLQPCKSSCTVHQIIQLLIFIFFIISVTVCAVSIAFNYKQRKKIMCLVADLKRFSKVSSHRRLLDETADELEETGFGSASLAMRTSHTSGGKSKNVPVQVSDHGQHHLPVPATRSSATDRSHLSVHETRSSRMSTAQDESLLRNEAPVTSAIVEHHRPPERSAKRPSSDSHMTTGSSRQRRQSSDMRSVPYIAAIELSTGAPVSISSH